VIDGNGLQEAKTALEDALSIQMEERDSSWYASVYYRCVIDKQRELQLCANEDFEGEPIVNDLDTTAIVLRVKCASENDHLLHRLNQLRCLRRVN
jgi:hypothetical protein